MGVWDFILDLVFGWIAQIYTRLKPYVENAIQAAIRGIQQVIFNVYNYVTNVVNNVYKYVTEQIYNTYNYITEQIYNAYNFITEQIYNTYNYITEQIYNTYNYITEQIYNTYNYITEVTEIITSWAASTWVDFTEFSSWLGTRILSTILGKFQSISNWLRGQNSIVNELIFGENMNLKRWGEGQRKETEIYAKDEDIKAVGDVVDFYYAPPVYVLPGKPEGASIATKLLMTEMIRILQWIVDHAGEVPDVMGDLVDSVVGTTFFDEDPPPPVKTPQEQAIEYMKLFQENKAEFIKKMRELRRGE